MAKRFYTCIIVPDASQRLHKLRIPEQAVYGLAAVGLLSFLVLIALGFNYAHMALKASDYDQLQAENTNLKIKTKDLQVSTTKLGSQINDLEDRSEKITKVIEDDPAFRGSKKMNTKPEGGSRQDLTTDQLIGNSIQSNNIDMLRGRAKVLDGQYSLLKQLVDQRRRMDAVTPNIWPVHGHVGSQFGSRTDPFEGGTEMHMGLDILAPVGTPVSAPAGGIVRIAQRETDYGNLIVIDHGNGLTSRYAHLKTFASTIHVGQIVTKNQLIGWVGMTGRSTGPHLHYEVRLNDKPVNPRNYLLGD